MKILAESLHLSLYNNHESFKEISQVKYKLPNADCKKSYYEKKWIFPKKGTKFEVLINFFKIIKTSYKVHIHKYSRHSLKTQKSHGVQVHTNFTLRYSWP